MGYLKLELDTFALGGDEELMVQLVSTTSETWNTVLFNISLTK